MQFVLFHLLSFPKSGQPFLFSHSFLLITGEAKIIHSSHKTKLNLDPRAGMIALRRTATELTHEDYMDGILEVQALCEK